MNSNVTLTGFTENQNQPKYDVISLTTSTSRWLDGGYFKLHNMKEIGGHNSMFINFCCRIVLMFGYKNDESAL